MFVAKRAAEKLTKKFNGIKIAWAVDGVEADELLKRPDLLLNMEPVDLLFVAFGHPKQEMFLKKIQEKMTGSFKVGVGVGGSLDYIAETKSHFPRLLAPIGLEWLGRLIMKPAHLIRVWRATIVFPGLLICGWFRRVGS